MVTNALDHLRQDSELAVIATVISTDPGTTARMLRLVNSVAFAPRTPVTSVQQAAALLGRNQVEALLISIAAKRSLPSPVAIGFEEQRFWRTAAKRAILAGLVASLTEPTRKSENFSAALLQDMAIPVLALRRDGYGDLLNHWHHSDDDLAELEAGAFGWHHGTIGGQLAASWNLPVALREFMSEHHREPDQRFLAASSVASIREVDAVGDEQFIVSASEWFDLETDLLVDFLAMAHDEATAMA